MTRKISPLLVSILATSLAAFAQSPITSGVQPGTTNFLGGFVVTNTPTPITQLFDITVVDPNGIIVTEFEVNTSTSHGTTGTFEVWITAPGGTHVGNHQNPAVWTQVVTQPVTHSGGVVSHVLATPFGLAPGTYGVALHYIGANPIYTNPNTQTPPLLGTYSTTEVTLDMTAARCRAADATGPFGGTSNGFSPRHPNLRMHYVSGLVSVDFVATPTMGTTPLPVQFTSFAVSGNPGGITAWLWDFENDGTVDSTAQNPSHTYTQCGSYDVVLTIVDSVGPHSTVKTGYIVTDVVEPNFSAQMIAPNMLQFTDTSTPTPTSWDWDLDGDGTTDSTAQNPTFTYTNACVPVNVTLTATLACQPPVSFTKEIAVAAQLETIRQGGLIISATATGGTNYIDVTVTHPDGITICGLHVRSNLAANATLGVELWQKNGTYVGAHTGSPSWRRVASESLPAAGPASMTFVPLTTPVYLVSGVHGLGIRQIGASPSYTNLGSAQTYTNADLSITAGLAQAEPIFSGTNYSPRIWNGAIYYSTSTLTGAAGYGYIGEGCPGSLGVSGNVAVSQPLLGTTMSIDFDNLAANAAIVALGFSDTISVLGPLPLDLGAFGAPGCQARVSPDATMLILGSSSAAQLPFTIPSGTGFIGVKLFTQAFAIDPGVNALSGVMSDAAAMIIGQ